MTTVHYAPTETVRAALQRYFEDNRFGADGGYGEAWVDLKVGPVPLPFPNTAGRVRAIRYHDLQHIVTGYATDVRGEAEIGAWELGAGCKSFLAAWHLNLVAATAGLVLAPRRTVRAFARGRRCNSLYGADYATIMAGTVGDLRAQTGIDGDGEAARMNGLDWILLAAMAIAGAAATVVSAVAAVGFVPLGLYFHHRRKRSSSLAVHS